MNDSMQFGPEWLRNLSQHDEENTMAIPKYQLAEHRYGREEMLALFDRTALAPEPLRTIGGLYVEKLQLPLALIQMSEEETRVWNSNVNNDISLRSLIKSTSSQVPNMSQASSGIGMSRGRGISADRGKNRTSRGPYHYNNRNYADEGTDPSHSSASFGRPRMFERSQSHNNERNWSERNGSVDYSDWNGYGGGNVENGLSTSPRKDFGTSMRLTSSREDTNWRRRPSSKDEDDGWRSNKHCRTGYNWREGGERDREKEKDNDGQEVSKDRRWITRISSMHSQPNRYSLETKDDSLPEWATESLGGGGGTFDSSGAFHGNAHSDDEDFMERCIRSHEDVDNNEKKVGDRDSHKVDDQKPTFCSERKPPITDQKNKVKGKSVPLPEALSTLVRHNPESSHGQRSDNVDTYALSASPPKSTVSKQLASQHQFKGSSPIDCYGREADTQNVSKEKTKLELDSRTSSQQTHSHLHEAYSQLQSKNEYVSGNSSDPMSGAYGTDFNFGAVDNSLIMNPTIVQNLAGNSNQSASLSNKLLISSSDVISSSISAMNAKDNSEKSESIPTVNTLIASNPFGNQGKSKDEDLDCIVGDVVSKFMAEEEEKEKQKKLDGMNKWFYRDPQGQVQGPFPNNEMAEWYKLGYFHDKSLIVRRAYESSYYPLHDLVTFLNGSPFETVTLQNFAKYSRATLPGIQLNQTPNTLLQSSLLPTNVPDESSLLLPQPQHYQTPFDVLYARQQQILAASKRQQSQPQEGMKSLFEQQKLMSQHINSTIDAGSGPSSTPTNTSQSTVPMMPGYMHPILPSAVPSPADPNLVMMLNQMQHQQHLHLLQQQLQQQQQHHHHHQQQQQQISHQRINNNDIKSDRLQQQPSQPSLMSHLDHPLQQLVHKINNLPAASQISMVQAQCGPSLHSVIPSVTNDVLLQAEESAALNSEKVQTTNAIQNLLKQLGVPAEKQSKDVDSIWGSANVSTVPTLNNNSFNAQHWCSQVGKIGPTSVISVANSGPVRLWMQDNAPPTAAMKTEQEIIESFMKSMRPQEESIEEVSNKANLLKKEEQLKHLDEAKKKEEEKKVKLEEEKRKKQEEEEKLRKIEEEQRRKAFEDAKRKEEERKQEEEKRKHKEEREEKRKAEEERKKRSDEPLQDLQRKQAEAMKRLKEQQQLAGTCKPSLKSVTTIVLGVVDQQPSTMQTIPKVPKTNMLTNQLSKSQSGEITSEKKRVRVASVEPQLSGQQAVANKQIGKSKSTSSVPTPNQKATIMTTETDKKAQEKKKKEKNPTNAWADQKKIPQVKSLAEIQAEEQKKLAKQIEREKQDRLLQQQQAAATALAAKEAINFNMWKSQNQPWKNSWTSSPSSSSLLSTNCNDSMSAINRQPNTVGTTSLMGNRGGAGRNSVANNTNSGRGKVPSDNNGEASNNVVNVRSKAKKEDATSKKSSSTLSSSSSTATQSTLRNDELSKWGMKALSGLKVSVDVPTFIGFLRDVESPNDVMEYVSDYLGDGKETKNFVKQFLEKRAASGFGTVVEDNMMTSIGNAKKSKNKKTTCSEESASTTGNAKEYYCSKEPVSKTNSAEFVEVKAKSKKSAKKKVLRVDPALLGFNVTAAPDRINIGERDFGEDVY